MKKITLLILSLFLSVNAQAEFNWDSLDLDLFDMDGITPRYAYVEDTYLGYMHYTGLAYLRKNGPISDGLSARVGIADHGTKFNLAYTNTFSLMGLDFGLTYTVFDEDNAQQNETVLEGLGVELGLRLWVVQVIGVHMEETSYVSLAYGF